MTVHIAEAALDVFEPTVSGTSRADATTTIPGEDIRSARLSAQIQATRDSGSFTVTNDRATYTGQVEVGDRVQFYTRLEGEASLSKRWTGLVRQVEYDVAGAGENTLSIATDDFVFGVLSMRRVTDEYESAKVAGTSNSIVNELVSENAPEVSLAQVGTIDRFRSVEYQRQNILDALAELAERTSAVMSSSGVELRYERKGTLSPTYTVTASDYLDGVKTTSDDGDMVNDVVVDGAREQALDIEQTQSDATETVTDSNRRTQQVQVRKGAMAAFAVYVTDSGSADNLVFRVQADDGGSPKDPDNRATDLARTTLAASEFSGTGWVKATLPDNNLPDPNPHIMVESDGSTGHEVHYDSATDELRYQIYYWFPVTLQSNSKSSIDDHRLREGRYSRETIRGIDEGGNIAENLIRARGEPEKTVEFGAGSREAHGLQAGEMVRVFEPRADVDGEFIITSISENYNGVLLGTSISATDAGSI